MEFRCVGGRTLSRESLLAGVWLCNHTPVRLKESKLIHWKTSVSGHFKWTDNRNRVPNQTDSPVKLSPQLNQVLNQTDSPIELSPPLNRVSGRTESLIKSSSKSNRFPNWTGPKGVLEGVSSYRQWFPVQRAARCLCDCRRRPLTPGRASLGSDLLARWSFHLLEPFSLRPLGKT